MLVDQRSLEQQMVRGSAIYNMKSSGYLHRPDSHVEIDVANGEPCTASDTSHLYWLLNDSVSMDHHCLERG